jgi:predicted neutral ceramidase superfamily lipid hydrolase
MEDLIANFNAAIYAFKILAPVFVFGLTLVLFIAGAYKAYKKTPFWTCAMVFAVFGIFGVTIGMFMGASRSDIVSSLLPPIITLISGYIVYLGSKDLSDQMKELIPGAVFVLLLSLLFSAYYMKAWYAFVAK